MKASKSVGINLDKNLNKGIKTVSSYDEIRRQKYRYVQEVK